jgi:uncharacterized membrane-anchored protein YhcB (DUF1043 family)
VGDARFWCGVDNAGRVQIDASTLETTMKNIETVLAYLAKCEPHRSDRARNRSPHIIDKIVRFLLWTGIGLFIVALVLAAAAKTHIVIAKGALLSGALMIAASPLLILASGKSLQIFMEELKNDRRRVRFLARSSEHTLKEVQHFLKLKIDRIEKRISQFFGDKAALLSLLAVTYSLVKDVGGVAWLMATFQLGFAPGNYANAAWLMALALIFGISIGALALKVLQRRYAYQLELVEMALIFHPAKIQTTS